MEADVTLSNIDVSIFRVYRFLRLYHSQFARDTLMNVASLDVKVFFQNLFSLLSKRIEIKSISLINPQFSLETDPIDGKLNPGEMFEKLSSKKTSDSNNSPLVI